MQITHGQGRRGRKEKAPSLGGGSSGAGISSMAMHKCLVNDWLAILTDCNGSCLHLIATQSAAMPCLHQMLACKDELPSFLPSVMQREEVIPSNELPQQPTTGKGWLEAALHSVPTYWMACTCDIKNSLLSIPGPVSQHQPHFASTSISQWFQAGMDGLSSPSQLPCRRVGDSQQPLDLASSESISGRGETLRDFGPLIVFSHWLDWVLQNCR